MFLLRKNLIWGAVGAQDVMILKLLETVPRSSVTYRPTAVELVPNSPTPTGWRNKSRKAKKHKVSILILTWRTSYLQLRTVNNALDFKHFLREFVLNQQYSLNSFILKYRKWLILCSTFEGIVPILFQYHKWQSWLHTNDRCLATFTAFSMEHYLQIRY